MGTWIAQNPWLTLVSHLLFPILPEAWISAHFEPPKEEKSVIYTQIESKT